MSARPFLSVYQQVTSEVQGPRGPPVPAWALQEDTWLSPFKAQKRASSKGTPLGTMQSAHESLYLLLWALPKHEWLHCSGLSCLHSSRSRALGCLSVLFLPTPAASKPAHICILITQMQPLPAQAPFRVFTLLIPFACHRPS